MNDKPIGIFDSGVGGLSVLRAVKALLPQENIVYFADTKNLPYGNKTSKEILSFYLESFPLWEKFQIKLLVIACHTASTICYHQLQKAPFAVIDMVLPSILSIDTKAKNLAFFATTGTLKSSLYQEKLLSSHSKTKFSFTACPDLAGLIEGLPQSLALVESSIEKYLLPFEKEDLDGVFLGCTHYSFAKSSFKKFLPITTQIIDPALSCAKKVKIYLETNNELNEQNSCGYQLLLSSKNPKEFSRKAHYFLSCDREYLTHPSLALNYNF